MIGKMCDLLHHRVKTTHVLVHIVQNFLTTNVAIGDPPFLINSSTTKAINRQYEKSNKKALLFLCINNYFLILIKEDNDIDLH